MVPGLIVPSRDETDPAALARTDATVPLGRAGVPDDLAGPVVCLASDDAAYMTGSFVTVDGGVFVPANAPRKSRRSPSRDFPRPTDLPVDLVAAVVVLGFDLQRGVGDAVTISE